MGIGRKGVRTAHSGLRLGCDRENKGGLLTGDGLVRSECSVIIAGYNTERRCQTDTLILAVGKGRCRSRGGIRLHLLIQLNRQSAEIHARDIQPVIIERKRNIMFPSGTVTPIQTPVKGTYFGMAGDDCFFIGVYAKRPLTAAGKQLGQGGTGSRSGT